MNRPKLVLEEALRIAELGYPVLPCNLDKQPILRAWPENATTDPVQIRHWFKHPDRLLAVKTGPDSDLFVLDVDPDGMEWLAINEEKMLCERVHETRRGKHFLYRFPDALRAVKTNTAGRVHAGVDTRGEGGCLIWWPAHGLGASGDLTDLTKPPYWLVNALAGCAEITKTRKGALHGVIEEGKRNDSLESYCGTVWANGASKPKMFELAVNFNAERNQPPLDIAEVESVVNSIARYERFTDVAEDREVVKSEDLLALSFVDQGPQLRYVAQWGKWMRWKDSVWLRDNTLETFDQIRQHVRIEEPKEPMFLKAHVVSAVEKFARADRRIAATVDQWDVHDHLLNTPDGPVSLQSGLMQDPDPWLYMSKSTIVSPKGRAPRWLTFLEEVTGGDIDYQLFLQRVIGYCAGGSTHEHAMFFLYGAGGNGKGIFLNTLQAVMGDYAKTAPMETFTDSKNDRHPTDMAMLQGARMVFAQETEANRAWAESKIKALTGGDPISARFMRQDFFTFTPRFKLLISGNHMPKLQDVDEAMRRRLYLLPFTQIFKGKDRDPHLAETLTHEYGGILQWIVEGAIAYKNLGLAPPSIVQEATRIYFEEEDVFHQWLSECCVQEVDAYTKPTELFASYKNFTDMMNEPAESERVLTKRLKDAGFTRGNSTAKGGRFWKGLKLRP